MNVLTPGEYYLRKSYKIEEIWKNFEKLEKLRSQPHPTLKVLQLQSQIEGPSRTSFMKFIKIQNENQEDVDDSNE